VLVPPVLAEALSNGRGPLRVGNGSFAVLGEGHIGLEADEGRRSLTQQTRYDSADILMAADPNVFSRFMLSPTRGDITGEEAIASGGVPTTER
jgi:hypothetical protein